MITRSGAFYSVFLNVLNELCPVVTEICPSCDRSDAMGRHSRWFDWTCCGRSCLPYTPNRKYKISAHSRYPARTTACPFRHHKQGISSSARYVVFVLFPVI